MRDLSRRSSLRSVGERSAFASLPPVKRLKKGEHPVDGLVRPRAYAVGQVEERLFATAGGQRLAAKLHAAAIGGEQAGEAFEECRLTCAVRADQAEDFALPHREAGVLQHGAASVAFGDALGPKQHG